MPAWLAAAAPAAISGVASLFGGAQAQSAARREAARNRQFQERMRNTAWQAAVADMEAAGINPALAFSQGPAASPGGSMASQQDFVSPSVHSALQGVRIRKELKLLDQQIAHASAQAQKTQSEKIYQDWMNRLWGSLTPIGTGKQVVQPAIKGPLWTKAEAEAETAKAVARLRELDLPMSQNLASIAGTDIGRMAAWLQYILRSMRR